MVLESDFLNQLADAAHTDAQVRVATSYRDALHVDKLNQVLWPQSHITKRHVMHYYASILPGMMPYIANQCVRPLLFPNGTHEDYFYPSFHPLRLPSFVSLALEDNSDNVCALINNEETLFYLLNIGAISLEIKPKRCLIWQLRAPNHIPFSAVAENAQALVSLIRGFGLSPYLKTNVSTFASQDAPRDLASNTADWLGVDILVPLDDKPVAMADAHRFFRQIHVLLAEKHISPGHQDAIELTSQFDLYSSRHPLSFGNDLKNTQVYPELNLPIISGTCAPFSLFPSSTPLVSAPISEDELTTEFSNPSYWTPEKMLEHKESRAKKWQGFFSRPSRFPELDGPDEIHTLSA